MLDKVKNNSSTDFNDFIDGLLEEVGSEGTVVFPCYNWDFCKGLAFDYRTTPSKTGSKHKQHFQDPILKEQNIQYILLL